MKKSIRVKQRDASDCGAACLASVAAYYDLHLSVAKIRQMASTNKSGTNINGMVEAAESLGFAAKGVKALDQNYKPKIDSLYKVPKPAIAHVITNKNLMLSCLTKIFGIIFRVTHCRRQEICQTHKIIPNEV